MIRTIKQLAEFTGASDTVVRSWIKRYKLPILKIEGRIYIQDEDYAKWLEEHKVVVDQIKKE